MLRVLSTFEGMSVFWHVGAMNLPPLHHMRFETWGLLNSNSVCPFLARMRFSKLYIFVGFRSKRLELPCVSIPARKNPGILFKGHKGIGTRLADLNERVHIDGIDSQLLRRNAMEVEQCKH